MTTSDHETLLPKSLRSRLDRSARTARLLVACDFDGTLAPIVEDPALARAIPRAAAALTELDRLADTTVAIVSGRARRDLRRLVDLPGTVRLIGSHGAEADTAPLALTSAKDHEDLHALVEQVAATLDGVRIEIKPFGAAVHFRSAPNAQHRKIGSAVAGALAKFPFVTIRHGHAVVEAALVPTTKGDAIRQLCTAVGATSILYCGDDTTDEDAFAVLRTSDLGVKVGPGPTLASEQVESPEALAAVLRALVNRRREG